jgi:hypothetical protein
MALMSQRARLLCHLVRMPQNVVLGMPPDPPKEIIRAHALKKTPIPVPTDAQLKIAKRITHDESFFIGQEAVIPLSIAVAQPQTSTAPVLTKSSTFASIFSSSTGASSSSSAASASSSNSASAAAASPSTSGSTNTTNPGETSESPVDRFAVGAYFMWEPPTIEKGRLDKMGDAMTALLSSNTDEVPFNRSGLPLTMLQPAPGCLGWKKLPKSSRVYKLPSNPLAIRCMNMLSQQIQPINCHHVLQRFIEAHGYVLLLRRASLILDGLNAMGKESIYSLMNSKFVAFLHCAKRACMHLLAACEQLQLDSARMFGALFSDRVCNDQLYRREFEQWRGNWGHANALWSAQAANRAEPLTAGNLKSGMAGKDPETTKSIEPGDGIAENLRVMISQLDEVAQFAAKDQAEELALHGERAALTAESLKAFVKNVEDNVIIKPPPAPTAEEASVTQIFARAGGWMLGHHADCEDAHSVVSTMSSHGCLLVVSDIFNCLLSQ